MDLVQVHEAEAREEVLRALKEGLVVALPTDDAYALVVDPAQPEALDRLFSLVGRPEEEALAVLVGSLEQAALVAGRFEPAAQRLAERFWPGPLTVVVPRRHAFRADLGGPPSARHTVGIRWPRHDFLGGVCDAFGPVAVGPVSRRGDVTTAEEVAAAFATSEELALVVDGGPCPGVAPTVVECRGPASKSLRNGALPWEELHTP